MRQRLLILAGILSLGFIGCGRTDAPEVSREAAEWVFRLGGTLGIEGRTKEIVSHEELPEEGYQITRITLNETRVKDEDLKQLAGLKSLRTLNLYGTEITDAGLAHITRLSTLEELELSYSRISDAGLAQLKNILHLKKLYLHGMGGNISPGGVKTLQDENPKLKIIR